MSEILELDFDLDSEEVFFLDEIEQIDSDDRLYCIGVASDEHTFLIEGGIPTCNTDEEKENNKLKGEASSIIGSIARLGRASGVHVMLATQRPDAKLIPGETKANLHVRVCCGRVDSTASGMILDNANGTRVKSFPRGRLFVQAHGYGKHAQGFYASPEWYEDYLEKNDVNGRGESDFFDDAPRLEGSKEDKDESWGYEEDEMDRLFNEDNV